MSLAAVFNRLRARVSNGQVVVRQGENFVGVDPSALTPNGPFVPAADNTFDLGEGTTPKRWRRLILAGYAVAASLGPSAAQQHTLPAVVSDTFALLNAAQTLVNKILTSPSFGNGTSIETGTVATADATVTNVWSKTLSDNTAYDLEILLVGRRTDSAGRAVYRRVVSVYREAGGGATLQGSVETPTGLTDQETTAGYDITVDVTGNDVRVRATGANGHAIRWNATVTLHSAAS